MNRLVGNRIWLKALAPYCFSIAACLVILVFCKLGRADLRIPFRYGGDGQFGQMMIKTIADHGWFLTNPSLGCPGKLDMRDYPMADNLHFFALKLLLLLTRNSAVAMNLYFLATFPLTTLTTHFAVRRMGIGHSLAIMTSVLFTFLPYHMLRGEGHLFLASYYLIPLMVLVILYVYLDRGLILTYDEGKQKVVCTWKRKSTWAGLLLCAVFASAGIYYAYFACVFLLVAGFASALYHRRLYPVVVALVLVGTIGLGAVASVSPSLLYQWRNGANPEIKRYWFESELYGMRITQLLLPIPGHRWRFFARWRELYDLWAPLNENARVSNGTIASLGFLYLVGRLLYRRRVQRQHPDLRDGLSALNISGILIATLGGFGALISLFGFHWIRAYNRVSIFLGFFALLAVATLLHRLSMKFCTSQARRWWFSLGVLFLMIAGVLDQTASSYILDNSRTKPLYRQDAEFVARIEAVSPKQGMVFQLPYVPFPESVPPGDMESYDHFRGYLHSKHLHWSYGAIKGRETDLWLREVASQPPEQLVDSLTRAGFCGIYINRKGYLDEAAELEDALSDLLQTAPLVSADQSLLFFPLTSYSHSVPHEFTAASRGTNAGNPP